MNPTFFGYWCGELPAVTELHFRSFVHHHPGAFYELWLDEDEASAIRAPGLQWIEAHPAIKVRHFSLDRLIERHVSAGPVLAHERGRSLKKLGRAVHRKIAPAWSLKRAWSHPVFGLIHKHSSALFGGYKSNKAYRGDLARCLVALDHYTQPSLYVDLDICFTSDLRLLCGAEAFTYRWEKFAFANSAVLYLPTPALSRRLVETGCELECFLPWILFTDATCTALGIRIHDTRLFDPLWDETSLLHGNPELFFEHRADACAAMKMLLQEAHAAIHWHNHWRTVPAPSSLYSELLKTCSAA